MSFRSSSVVTFLLLSAPTHSFAADIFDQLPVFDGTPSLGNLRTAYQAVHQDPAVRELLDDGDTNALSIAQRVSGLGVETTKFQHFYKGLEVMGSMTFHHASEQGTRIRNLIQRFDLDTRPGLTREAAIAIAKSVAGDLPVSKAPELKILPAKNQDAAQLVYWVDLDNVGYHRPGAEVLINAQDGRLIANISKLETLAPVQVLTAKDQGLTVLPVVEKDPTTNKPVLKSCTLKDLITGVTTSVPVAQCKSIVRGQDEIAENKCQVILLDDEESGSPLSVDPSSCKRVVSRGVASPQADQSALNALSNSNKVLSYYRDVHGRDGFDDAGSEVVSIVHAGLQYGNAAWVKGLDFMMYGDGDGELMGDMTKGLDVAGHELTHGVTSKTAKLTMMDESGALNEAYSDFFGKMIAQDGSWIVGESLSLNKVKFPGIRNLKDPKAFRSNVRNAAGEKVSRPYPVKAGEAEKKLPTTTCDSSNDRCWVHFNSTVPSHASYRIYNAIGPEKTQALYYLTLTQYLSSEAGFTKAAQATLAACQAKFDPATCDQVRKIFVESEMLPN